jgi:tetratricopeptide (TPR) repeat protein
MQSDERRLEMAMRGLRATAFSFLMAVAPMMCAAQSAVLDLPLQSQAAEVSQTIGITEITIKYHRPLVGERKIWDGLLPFGKVWRAGANMNTTIAFSDPVTIEGKPLDKGVYGLHMIPNADEWTIIFSKNSTSWGSFTYDEQEDALRVNVKPETAEMHNALTYEFDRLQPDSAVVELKWEKVAVPFKIAVDVHALAQASLKKQLRNLSGFDWVAWNDAAGYLLNEKIGLDDALADADKSIEYEDRFDNEMTKSKVLMALDRKDEATAAEKKALGLASPIQVHTYARQLLTEKRTGEAIAIFTENARKHPGEWFVHAGMARAYCAQGKFDEAAREMRQALDGAPDNQKKSIDVLVKRLQAREDINL